MAQFRQPGTNVMLDSADFGHKIEPSAIAAACAVEALEQLLIERGILAPNELRSRMEEVARTKVLPGGDG